MEDQRLTDRTEQTEFHDDDLFATVDSQDLTDGVEGTSKKAKWGTIKGLISGFQRLISGKIFTTDRVSIGNNNATGTDYLSVGNATNGSTADAKVLINHNLDDASGSGNSHAFTDETIITRTGDIGYNSFQAKADINVEFDHYNGFQTDVEVNTSTTGIVRGARHSAYGSGSAEEFRGIEIYDPSLTIDKAYGLFINKIDNGTSFNRAIKTFGGLIEFANNTTTGDIEVLRISRNQVSAGNKQTISFVVGGSEVVAGEIVSEWKGGGDSDLKFNTTLNNVSNEVMKLTDTGNVEITQVGKGIVLTSPDGLTTKTLTIDNSGAIALL